jgi:hypothetical protein
MKGVIEPDEGRPLIEFAANDSDEGVRMAAQQLEEMWQHAERVEQGRAES